MRPLSRCLSACSPCPNCGLGICSRGWNTAGLGGRHVEMSRGLARIWSPCLLLNTSPGGQDGAFPQDRLSPRSFLQDPVPPWSCLTLLSLGTATTLSRLTPGNPMSCILLLTSVAGWGRWEGNRYSSTIPCTCPEMSQQGACCSNTGQLLNTGHSWGCWGPFALAC